MGSSYEAAVIAMDCSYSGAGHSLYDRAVIDHLLSLVAAVCLCSAYSRTSEENGDGS